MRTSAAVAFCLLLGLVLLQAVSADKPGTCPPLTMACTVKTTNNCTKDIDCPENQKCCNRCGMKCTPPIPDLKLLSVCPAFDPEICSIVRPGKPECHNDGNCTGNRKCCCSKCGLRCVEPERVKPGRCSNILAKCNPTLMNNTCKTDMDCQGNQKCCKLCGMKCRDPMPEPAGFCPVNDAEEVLDFPCPSSKCSRDSDCAPDEKCCNSKDGQKCVKPITVIKPGTCPAAEPARNCGYDNRDQCHNDDDCGGNKKCCASSCSKECKEPAPKPGLCPVDKVFCPAMIDYKKDKCHHDSECPAAQKCCSGCGMQCVDPQKNKVPKNGLCPPFMPAGTVSHIVCTKLNTTECTYDSDCGGRKKCCSQMCNNVCRDPVIVPKNGSCPPFMPAGTVSHIACTKLNTTECTYDSDCGGRKKCCNQMCNNVCRDPVIVPKNGLCPPFMPAGTVSHIVCTKLNTTECTYDSDCGGRKKCCSQMCNNVCRDPVIVPKNGLCPPFMPAGTVSHIACTKLNTTECTYDSDCGGRKKCCSQMCNNVCRDPVIAKPGCCPTGRLSCPRQPVGGFKDLCQNDFNCTGDMKCCNRCGKRCTAPDTTERSGSCPANIYMCPLQTGPPDNECECDNQCPPNKKCCSRCDGKKCVDPKAGSTVIKAGTCPVVNTLVACSLPLPQSCGSDSQCDGEEKCCTYGCEVRCTKPVN
ncbi:uncharacterized protein [Hyperolius riggenbachi]|uniref:uncharacterized protein isoform X2 n=1 Tax=Hyperolius riggenbachi TaxID=752182 RepID=UPI0035A2948D